ncbi:MAG: MoaD family protein [Hadesarchaea archaeon]|nr:MoaD family protein [Hadesarchaea archaeon]
MEVVIKLHGDLCEKAGTDTIKLPIDENETIDTLLMKLGRRHSYLLEAILDPQTGELKSHYNILLNGRRVQQLRGIHTKLKHKDELAIFPPESGG